MNATSSPASELLVLSAFIYRNSITFLHSSRWSFSNSVKRIVLSSLQVNENQPTTSRLCCSSPLVWCGACSIAMSPVVEHTGYSLSRQRAKILSQPTFGDFSAEKAPLKLTVDHRANSYEIWLVATPVGLCALG